MDKNRLCWNFDIMFHSHELWVITMLRGREWCMPPHVFLLCKCVWEILKPGIEKTNIRSRCKPCWASFLRSMVVISENISYWSIADTFTKNASPAQSEYWDFCRLWKDYRRDLLWLTVGVWASLCRSAFHLKYICHSHRQLWIKAGFGQKRGGALRPNNKRTQTLEKLGSLLKINKCLSRSLRNRTWGYC